MKLRKAIKILKIHNAWRRGEEIPMQCPAKIGVAIDTVIEHYKQEKQMQGRRIKITSGEGCGVKSGEYVVFLRFIRYEGIGLYAIVQDKDGYIKEIKADNFKFDPPIQAIPYD